MAPLYDRTERTVTDDQIVEATARQLSEEVRSWLPEDTPVSPVSPVAEWLSVELDRIDSLKFATQLDRVVPVNVSDPILWANHVIPLSGGRHWALAAARFRNQDLDKPFVDVIATSLPQDDSLVGILGDPADGRLQRFRDFSPRALRVYVAAPTGFVDQVNSTDGPVTTTVDQNIVAMPVHERGNTGKVESLANVELVEVSPAQAAAETQAIYRAVGRANPELPHWAQPSDEESLADCASDGLLFQVHYKGEPAGIIAARSENSYGLTGWVTEEKCIDPAFQGQSLSTAAAQRLLDLLPEEKDGRTATLWGHIDDRNVPSQRSAEKVGRRTVGGHVWIVPEGLTGII